MARPFRRSRTSTARLNIRGWHMPEVRCVVAVVSNPIGPDDPGRATYGYYILEDGLLTMTDGNGTPVRNTFGEKETHRLQDGEDPDYIAKRRAVKIHRQ